MSKKFLFISSIVLIGITTMILGLNHYKSRTDQHMTLAQAEKEARIQTKLPVCLELESQNEPNETDANSISNVVGAKLTDRPKTIAYSLYYKAHDSTKATGTIIYDGESGNTFNFVVNRTGEAKTWRLSSFEVCQ